jgi:hypothetical protein
MNRLEDVLFKLLLVSIGVLAISLFSALSVLVWWKALQ